MKMQLSFENPDFTRYLHKPAASSTTASQLTQISSASKPTSLENKHSKYNLYLKASALLEGLLLLRNKRETIENFSAAFFSPVVLQIDDYNNKIKLPVRFRA